MNKKFQIRIVFLFFGIAFNTASILSANLILKNQIKGNENNICFRDLGKIEGTFSDHDLKRFQEKCFLKIGLDNTQKQILLTKPQLELFLLEHNFFLKKLLVIK